MITRILTLLGYIFFMNSDFYKKISKYTLYIKVIIFILLALIIYFRPDNLLKILKNIKYTKNFRDTLTIDNLVNLIFRDVKNTKKEKRNISESKKKLVA